METSVYLMIKLKVESEQPLTQDDIQQVGIDCTYSVSYQDEAKRITSTEIIGVGD